METELENKNKIAQLQVHMACLEVAEFCAKVCDVNKGHLNVGDQIRKMFKISNTEPISTPESKVENKKSHLSLIKN